MYISRCFSSKPMTRTPTFWHDRIHSLSLRQRVPLWLAGHPCSASLEVTHPSLGYDISGPWHPDISLAGHQGRDIFNIVFVTCGRSRRQWSARCASSRRWRTSTWCRCWMSSKRAAVCTWSSSTWSAQCWTASRCSREDWGMHQRAASCGSLSRLWSTCTPRRCPSQRLGVRGKKTCQIFLGARALRSLIAELSAIRHTLKDGPLWASPCASASESVALVICVECMGEILEHAVGFLSAPGPTGISEGVGVLGALCERAS